jgi:hypothetical protein
MRLLINMTAGRYIRQQGESEDCHVTGCIWDSQSHRLTSGIPFTIGLLRECFGEWRRIPVTF